MNNETMSLKDWQKMGFYIFKTETLTLSQTYKEWLKQNPKGYDESE